MEKKILEKLKELVSSESPSQSSMDSATTKKPTKQSAEEKINSAIRELIDKQEQHYMHLLKSMEVTQDLLARNAKALEETVVELKRLGSISDQLVRALEVIPKSNREQVEKLSAIEEQLSSESQTDKMMLTTLDNLGRNVASLARIAENLQGMQENFAKDTRILFEPMLKLVRKQGRLSSIIVALSLAILVVLIIFFFFIAKVNF